MGSLLQIINGGIWVILGILMVVWAIRRLKKPAEKVIEEVPMTEDALLQESIYENLRFSDGRWRLRGPFSKDEIEFANNSYLPDNPSDSTREDLAWRLGIRLKERREFLKTDQGKEYLRKEKLKRK